MTCHAARRVNEFERRLRRERAQVWRALETTDVELASLDRHEAGEFVDDAARNTTRRLLERIEARDRRVLADIDAAEARLAAGTFGVCEACGLPITAARLRALPTARLCIACRRRVERRQVS
jgi:DnaK suppressor protein